LKLAFYAEREVRRKTGLGVGAVDLLSSASQQTQIEIGPDGKKQLVGPVISLTDPLPGGSNTLSGGPSPAPAAPSKDSTQTSMIDKGEALPSIPGRIDDYAWPPRSADVPPTAEVLPQPPSAPATQTKTDGQTAADKAGVLTPISKAN
jgi:hypothetical protein